jgi:hypothetical protein
MRGRGCGELRGSLRGNAGGLRGNAGDCGEMRGGLRGLRGIAGIARYRRLLQTPLCLAHKNVLTSPHVIVLTIGRRGASSRPLRNPVASRL